MPPARSRRLFDELKAELVPLIARVTQAAGRGRRGAAVRTVSRGAPARLVAEVVALMGFDEAGWRLDDTVHPFATRIGGGDVRITTRWDERFFPTGLYGAMHECGHGLYEAGIPAHCSGSPLGSAESLGMHESQSRLWENMVGPRPRRSVACWRPGSPELAGGELAGLDADRLYPRRQSGQALVHPGRGRRGDVRACTSCCAPSSSRRCSRGA